MRRLRVWWAACCRRWWAWTSLHRRSVRALFIPSSSSSSSSSIQWSMVWSLEIAKKDFHVESNEFHVDIWIFRLSGGGILRGKIFLRGWSHKRVTQIIPRGDKIFVCLASKHAAIHQLHPASASTSIVPSWREQNQSFKHYFSTRLIVARLYMGISKNKVHQSIPRRI